MFPGNIIVDLSRRLQFLGPEGTKPVAVETKQGLVVCPTGDRFCPGLQRGEGGVVYCGRAGDSQASGDIERCYNALNVIAGEAVEAGTHPETNES